MSAVASALALVASTSLFNTLAMGQDARQQVVQIPAVKPAWLGGSSKDLRIKLAGKILEETGAPANGCKLTVILKTRFAQTNLPAEVERNQFQAWVPISDASLFNVYLNAASPDGRRVAREAISAFQLRQAALDGLELTIKAARTHRRCHRF